MKHIENSVEIRQVNEKDEIKETTKEVIECLTKHSLSPVGYTFAILSVISYLDDAIKDNHMNINKKASLDGCLDLKQTVVNTLLTEMVDEKKGKKYYA